MTFVVGGQFYRTTR